MITLTKHFVNREQHLAALRKIIRREQEQRILLVIGPGGIGKTYLLDECRAACLAMGIACARVDFADSSDQSYTTIVLDVSAQLGSTSFERLIQTTVKALDLSSWETAPIPRAAPMVARLVADAAASEGRSGGVDLHDPATIGGDVVGRDVIHITQIIQRDDPRVQQVIRAEITAAFRDCLLQIAAERPVILLIDSWERATTEIRDWLRHGLLNWITAKNLSSVAVIVAGREVPDLHWASRHVRQMALTRLSDEAVRTYWVERRGLPSEDLPGIIRFSRGNPIVVALMADERAQAEDISH